MKNFITIFKGTTGLNTVADPVRIPMTESVINDVAEIVNMRIDQYGRPSSRPGFSLVQEGIFHSIFCAGGDCFVLQKQGTTDSIMQIAKDGSLTGIRSGLVQGRKMAWVQHGSETFYSNSLDRGIIKDGVSRSWVTGEYHGPDTDKTFTVPEQISQMVIHSGRMFVSVGSTLWWSEPFRFDLFNLAESFIQFSSTIRMVNSVGGGIFVSSSNNTYFLSGRSPKEFQLNKVAYFPAVEGSCAVEKVDGRDLGITPGLCALWASPEGAILGAPDGLIINLTKAKIIYPENISTGFGVLVGYEYIHGMK